MLPPVWQWHMTWESRVLTSTPLLRRTRGADHFSRTDYISPQPDLICCSTRSGPGSSRRSSCIRALRHWFRDSLIGWNSETSSIGRQRNRTRIFPDRHHVNESITNLALGACGSLSPDHSSHSAAHSVVLVANELHLMIRNHMMPACECK